MEQVDEVGHDVRLSPTSYVVLGLIALRGASTPYELKRAVGRSVGYFWPFPHSQLYSEPDRLVEAGLLAVEQEGGGRRRKTYSITAKGRDAIRIWLREPAGEAFQLRNIAELKLFFAELGEERDIVELAREQIRLHEERLAELDAIDTRFKGTEDSAVAGRLVPLQLGRELERTALEFWRALVEDRS
jgi:PadR family transcriptional regulator AphA